MGKMREKQDENEIVREDERRKRSSNVSFSTFN
jgi:hypothetical protein